MRLPSALLVALAMVLGIGPLGAGPGLLPRQADRYYQAPIRRWLYEPENLPARPPPEMARSYQESDVLQLREAGYFEEYKGPDLDQDRDCHRYLALYLLGGYFQEMSTRYGALFPRGEYGAPRLRLPASISWGKEQVLAAMAQRVTLPQPLKKPWWRRTPIKSQDKPPEISNPNERWWRSAPSRYEAARWIQACLEKLDGRVHFLRDPVPYQRLSQGDLPYYGHPLRKRLKAVLTTHLMQAPRGEFQGRSPLRVHTWIRTLARLRFANHGYRDLAPLPEAEQPE